MPVVLNITAESAVDLVHEFRRLNELTSSTMDVDAVLRAVPLNDFITLANKRLEADGFMVACRPAASEPGREVDPPAVAEPDLPEPKAKRTRTAPYAEAKQALAARAEAARAEPSNVEEFPAPRRSKPAAAPAPSIGSDDEDPESDRQHVLDTLAGILKDPARKAEVLAFTGEQAKRHGGEKISQLPAAPFPEIRREMEKAFPDARSA